MGKVISKIGSLLSVVALSFGLASCATLFEGTSQEIVINTNPAGASCSLMRSGLTIGTVQSTPGSVVVKKTKEDITIKCSRQGYEDVALVNKSGMAGASFANVLGYGILPITVLVDSASGADNKYETEVSIQMVAKPEKAPVAGAASPGK